MESNSIFSGLACLIIPALCCFVPLAGLLILGALNKDRLTQLLGDLLLPASLTSKAVDYTPAEVGLLASLRSPDPVARWQATEFKYPTLSLDERVQKLIHEQAFNTAFIGFATGFLGPVSSFVTMPVDLITTGRIQAEMVGAIAHACGKLDPDEDPLDVRRRTFMLMVGGEQLVTQLGQYLGRYVVWIVGRSLGRSLLKSVPVLGAIMGGVFEYLITRGIGEFAVKRYTGQFSPQLRTILNKTQDAAATLVSQGALKKPPLDMPNVTQPDDEPGGGI